MVNQLDDSAEQARRQAISEGMRRARNERKAAAVRVEEGLDDLRKALRNRARPTELLMRLDLIEDDLQRSR